MRIRLGLMWIGRLFSPLRGLVMPLRRANRLGSTLPVRGRIVTLALIPVIGFAAAGISYICCEGQISQSFATVTQSHHLAHASRDFKIAVAAMRIAAKNFSASPH